ncbi:hypothetical protein [uncultured Dokdonia sp.]|uniref:hypothetical protein n=1 Tax=uncultured Dokdonia sp. TaxID=575653 RepID=UPI00260C558E|nr:hypothetical protein [uncultured Dokdonia sp.]
MKSVIFLISFLFSFITVTQNYNLPPNPENGKCYVKCFNKKKTKLKWEEVHCSLMTFQELEVAKDDLSQGLSKEDIAIIDNILVPHIKQGYKLDIQSHYVSEKSSTSNMENATQRVVLIGNYLIEKGLDPALLVARSYGDTKSETTSIEYRIINTSKVTE